MGSATTIVDVDVAVRLLGPVDVLVDGRRLLLVGVKQRAIVAMLALEAGAVVSVDRLIDGIWGADSPPSVRSSVQVHVSQVR
ncbi:MAG: winged helix-turn-helix domain-containing protein, partial [Ilumatobacteraceae bacterium]